MFRVRAALAVVLSIVGSTSLLAQSKPGQPGPPSTAPQVVVDSTGSTVGPVVELVNGLSRAYVNYPLPNGDSVVMIATSGALTGAIALAPVTDPMTAKAFFTSANCSGDAYVQYSVASAATQLTRYQSATISGLFPTQLPPPAAGSSCPIALGDQWLYTTFSGECPVMVDQFHPITFHSYYGNAGLFGTPAPGAGPLCVVPPGGSYTLPSNLLPATAFVVYAPVENLSLKYKAPFYVK